MTNAITTTCSSIISTLFGHVGAFSSWLARPYVFINLEDQNSRSTDKQHFAFPQCQEITGIPGLLTRTTVIYKSITCRECKA